MQNISYSNNHLKSILDNNKFGRYFEDTDLDINESMEHSITLLSDLLEKEEILTIENEKNKNSEGGLLIYKISNWDSIHFEKKTVIIEQILISSNTHNERFRTASTLLSKFKVWCINNEIKFVMSKVSSIDLPVINALEKIGFNFIESWIYNKYDLQKHISNPENNLELRLAKSSDLDYMLEFSLGAFSKHRFHADPNITLAKAESLYSKWIKTSFNDENQNILVYDHNGIPSAFMTYYFNDLTHYFNKKYIMWRMAFLNPEIKGIGIGTQFFQALFDYHKNEGYDIIDSGLSLRNTVSLNLHNKLSFKVTSTLTNLHLWL